MAKPDRPMTNTKSTSVDQISTPKASAPRVVIVGGGFGGFSAAKALRKAPVEVILIDRENHHQAENDSWTTADSR
jgi:NADPH-dependent 2,4-dienoyl-CoA reductase/sulfur reductase-like enzyme